MFSIYNDFMINQRANHFKCALFDIAVHRGSRHKAVGTVLGLGEAKKFARLYRARYLGYHTYI